MNTLLRLEVWYVGQLQRRAAAAVVEHAARVYAPLLSAWTKQGFVPFFVFEITSVLIWCNKNTVINTVN